MLVDQLTVGLGRVFKYKPEAQASELCGISFTRLRFGLVFKNAT